MSQQLKSLHAVDCGLMIVDLSNGTVNGLNPVSSPQQIKSKLPCFNLAQNGMATCPGAIFNATRDVYFYTGLDCISIKSKFEGTFFFNNKHLDLIGMNLSALIALFGKPLDYHKPDAPKSHKFPIFVTNYGLLVFDLENDHVSQVTICNQKRSELKICD